MTPYFIRYPLLILPFYILNSIRPISSYLSWYNHFADSRISAKEKCIVVKYYKKALWRLITSLHKALILTIHRENEQKYKKIIGNQNKYTLYQYWFPIMAEDEGFEFSLLNFLCVKTCVFSPLLSVFCTFYSQKSI